MSLVFRRADEAADVKTKPAAKSRETTEADNSLLNSLYQQLRALRLRISLP